MRMVTKRPFGRPKKMTKEQVEFALQLYFVEGLPVRQVADVLRVSHMTVWRVVANSPPPQYGWKT
ncbi:MAG: helix-turn-helix domain-containing protein [Candidatus Anstonellaceae archaeon]